MLTLLVILFCGAYFVLTVLRGSCLFVVSAAGFHAHVGRTAAWRGKCEGFSVRDVWEVSFS